MVNGKFMLKYLTLTKPAFTDSHLLLLLYLTVNPTLVVAFTDTATYRSYSISVSHS